MLRKFILVLSACLVCFSLLIKDAGVGAAQVSSQEISHKSYPLPSSQELAAVKDLAQTLDFLQSEKGKEVWEGYNLSSSPLVISFENHHLYAFNLQSNNPAWQTITVAGKAVKYSAEDPWGASKVQMHPSFDIDGQTAFVYHFDLFQQGPSFLPLIILVHECFHQYQFDHFFMDKTALEGYKDHLNADNLSLMQLEELLLVDFLKPGKTFNIEKLKDFVAVNIVRQEMLQQASLLWERNQQRMEGLADYVSIKTFAVSGILNQFNDRLHLLFTMQMSATDDNVSDRAIKRRHYGIGATLGYALDHLQIADWKKQVEQQNKGLDELIQKAVNLSHTEVVERVKQIKEAYHFNDIKNKVTSTLHQYQNEIATDLKAYQEMEGVEVIFQAPPGFSVSGGGSNSQMFYLADGSTLFVNNNSVSTTTDSLWKLILKGAPYLFQSQSGDKHFKIENDLEITLDQKVYHLSELLPISGEKQFTVLKCEGKFGTFQSETHPGVILIENGKIVIKYNTQSTEV